MSARARNESGLNKSISGRSEGDGRKDTLISGFSEEDVDNLDLSGSELID